VTNLERNPRVPALVTATNLLKIYGYTALLLHLQEQTLFARVKPSHLFALDLKSRAEHYSMIKIFLPRHSCLWNSVVYVEGSALVYVRCCAQLNAPARFIARFTADFVSLEAHLLYWTATRASRAV
jgi:hypothetical protein